MDNKGFFAALSDLEREKGINMDSFITTLELAFSSAYKKNYGVATPVVVKIDADKSVMRMFTQKTVVAEVTDPDKEVSLEEARELRKTYKEGDVVQEKISPKDFGRIAAQTAKQVVLQHLRDMERNNANIQFAEMENELLTCLIHRVDGENVYVEVAPEMEGLLSPQDQIKNEHYAVNDRIKVYVKRVKSTPKGPQILVSRSHTGFVKRLFELEVPEIRQGVVVIKAMSRDAGGRTKMAVASEDAQVDAVGACVGSKGVRVNAVVRELGGEKVDIVEWCQNPAEFIARALSPAKVLEVEVDPDENAARVVVPDDKLSLAIGKDGQNVRLAARLTGWKIDVKAQSYAEAHAEEFAEPEAFEQTEEFGETEALDETSPSEPSEAENR